MLAARVLKCHRNIYAIMKAICPPSYHHINFVETRALWDIIHDSYIYELLTCVSNLHIHQAYKMWDVKHKISDDVPLLKMNDFIAAFFKRFNCYLIFFKMYSFLWRYFEINSVLLFDNFFLLALALLRFTKNSHFLDPHPYLQV